MRFATLLALALSLAAPACKPAVATEAECDKAAEHLASLVVAREKKPPMGRLASPPFNGPDEVKAVHDEAFGKSKAQCKKGWKRSVYDCMLALEDLAGMEKCRFE
jgi:hypothetical protein